MATGDEFLELPGWLYDSNDYTYYLRSSSQSPSRLDYRIYHDLLESQRFAPHRFSASFSGRVVRQVGVWGFYLEGRILACRCYRGREVAVTLRRLNEGKGRTPKNCPKLPKPLWNDDDCRYKPEDADTGGVPFPVGLGSICDLIEELALKKAAIGAAPTGLILVTGATNSAKSELTRGLIHRVLKSQANDKSRKRRPHLLTYEDPIEKWLFLPENDVTSDHSLDRGVEYTPREKGVDVGSLKDAVDDVLRQTPSVFYVGEVRDNQDWAELLRFAGTGHLVIATAHAGSLIEAMERIFDGVHAQTAAERGQIAQRILGVIHQIKFDLRALLSEKVIGPDFPSEFPVLLPSIWRRTPGGMAALVSDGLSSVLPNNPDKPATDGTSSFGRRWFATELAKAQKKSWTKILHEAAKEAAKKTGRPQLKPEEIEVITKHVKEHFELEAIRYDLIGI